MKLIISFLFLFVLSTFAAEARNEYLNNNDRCGEIDLSVEQRDSEYRPYDNSWSDRGEQNLRLTFRKYLGTDCKTSKENMQ